MAQNNQEEGQVDLLRLNDFQHYLDTRGLPDEHHVGAESQLNLSETRKRLADALAYQESIHRKVFQEIDTEDEQSKRVFLQSLQDDDKNRILIHTMDGLVVESTVKQLASTCDTIYAMAKSRDMYKKQHKSEVRPPLDLSLESFSQNAVQEFVRIATGTDSLDTISSENAVECCQIAHYLQCQYVLNPLVDILIDAVDATNCRSLLELADRLGFPLLFERSLSHMMKSLEETECVWDDLSEELRNRVNTMKAAIESSILAGKSRLYFGSIQEYLAMFAETLRYHQERLSDSKQRQTEEKTAHLVRSHAWEYNQQILDRQEQQVQRMEMIMKKQREIFSSKRRE